MIRHPIAHVIVLTAIVLPLGAQRGDVDRRTPPVAGPNPALVTPAHVRTRLANGAELLVVPRRGVPMVSFSLVLDGGQMTVDPPGLAGATSVLLGVMERGSRTTSEKAFADAVQRLGTFIGFGSDREQSVINFLVVADRFERALRLAADAVLHPAFDSVGFEAVRQRHLTTATSWRDQLNPLATAAVYATIYGDRHPYGAGFRATEPLRRLTLEDIRRLHRAYVQPGRAIITVVGDVDPVVVRRQIEAAFGAWSGERERPVFAYPTIPPLPRTSIALVDRPGASQTQLVIGLPVISRTSPDVRTFEVLNQILGQTVQSRLSRNLREQRGYTYDAFSFINWGWGQSPFLVVTAVDRSKTDSAIVEIFRELRGLRGEIPFTDAEIADAKQALSTAQLSRFATLDGTNFAMRSLVLLNYPMDDYAARIARYQAVTREDLVRVAREYLDPDRMVIGVAGDRAVIEASLKRLNLGPIVLHDPEGKVIP